jgi:AcrR family transcriptional regulator
MRVKTEARRQVILAAAAEAFRELGVEGTSMSALAARLGGSKSTLYAYFSSKEELVLEILLATGEKQGQASLAEIDNATDVRAGLMAFGAFYLSFITAPDTVAILRIAIAEGGRSDLGRQFFARGPALFLEHLSSTMERLIARGALRPGQPLLMAHQLKALFEAESMDRLLFGVGIPARPDALEQLVANAVDGFLAMYGS